MHLYLLNFTPHNHREYLQRVEACWWKTFKFPIAINAFQMRNSLLCHILYSDMDSISQQWVTSLQNISHFQMFGQTRRRSALQKDYVRLKYFNRCPCSPFQYLELSEKLFRNAFGVSTPAISADSIHTNNASVYDTGERSFWTSREGTGRRM